jgi:hypothetical protein
VSSFGAFLIAFAVGVGIFVYQTTVVWTPLQRWYWNQYLGSEVFPVRGNQPGNYHVLAKLDRHNKPLLAVDADVVPGPIEGKQLIPFTLSQQARKAGAVELKLETVRFPSQQLHKTLSDWIYQNQSPDDLIGPAFYGGLGTFVLGLILAIPRDRERARILEHGRRLKGPQMVTVKEFNQWSGANGIGFVTTKKKETLSIPRAFESSHVMIMGDSGAGKSVLQRQLLMQIAARGETAIVYDPALEYAPQFFNPERGDLILNPLDARCPYWSPCDEVIHEAEALTLATSLFPDKPHENTFFVEGPRKIFAHLLTLKPAPDRLVWWMSHEEELDRLLKGTELAAFIYRGAGPQRGGVLGALNMVADSLKLLPKQSETKQRWATEEWARRKNGWLFLTSIPRFRERLLPLMSLWLDTLVLRLMNQGDPAMRHAWSKSESGRQSQARSPRKKSNHASRRKTSQPDKNPTSSE